MKSFKLLLAVIFALTILIPVLSSIAAPAPPRVIEDILVTGGSAAHKWPSVAIGNGAVNIAWSSVNQANFAQRLEEGGPFGYAVPGSVGNNSTYFTAANAVGQDGVVHYAWIDSGNTIFHRTFSAAGFSPVHTVATNRNFANTLNIAVRGTGEVFLAWRTQDANNGALGFAFSRDAGNTWPLVGFAPTPQGIYAGRPDLVAGPANLPVYLAWTGADGKVYLGEWNGGNFNTICLSCLSSRYAGRDDFFGASVAMTNDGRPYVAWRGINGGVFYASRQPNGAWGFSNAFSYPDVSSVGIAVDKLNNVHMAWLSKVNNRIDVYYAVSAPQSGGGENFSNPPTVFSGDNGAFKANLDITANVKPGYALAHIAYESFAGGQFIRYARVQTDGIGCVGGVAAASYTGRAMGPRAIFMNPIYMPMLTHPAPPPLPTPTPLPPTPTPTPSPTPSC